MTGQVVHQPGVDCLDLLQGQPSLGDPKEDQCQVARCADHQVGQCRAVAGSSCASSVMGPSSTTPSRVWSASIATRGTRRGAVGGVDLGQHRRQPAPLLGRLGRLADGIGLDPLPDELLHRLAVALTEGGAQALSVVGEDDEPIWSRAVGGKPPPTGPGCGRSPPGRGSPRSAPARSGGRSRRSPGSRRRSTGCRAASAR